MRNFKVFVDSHCDYTKEEIEKMGFEYVSMPYSINNKLVYPYTEDYSSHVFYQSLRDGTIVKTHALSPYEYTQLFEPALKDGYDIVYISISDKMTGTHLNAENAWEAGLRKKYPNRTFYMLKTQLVTAAERLCVDYAASLTNVKNLDDFVTMCERFFNKVHVYFFTENLTYLKRSGRLSSAAAFAGNLLNVKPILTINHTGTMKLLKKAHGIKGAIKELITLIDLYKDFDNDTILIGVSDNKKLEAELKEAITHHLPNLKVNVVTINPTSGAHCGPDTVGVAFVSKEPRLIL